ncbi:MAG: acetyl-CoA carboxylase biotin carboxyl carrier protein [Planctomycetota bacterium]|nr:MAG: acetyl-CoA carboxylase biotin carboxyl carrier protein [Planctomycetota bacterium]
MDEGALTEIAYETEDARIRLSRRQEGGQAVVLGGAAAAAPAPAPSAAAPAPAAAPEPAEEEGLVIFTAPMVGTFYRAPNPEASPYVSVGDTVGPDSVLCILEAMKVMNEIKAETSGEIVAILAENGEPVEFGQPLFKIRPA